MIEENTTPELKLLKSKYEGMKVIYRSGSGKEYEAIITRIPDRYETSCEHPIVTLLFDNNRNKAVTKERVLPIDAASIKRQVWIYAEGKYAWKDGLFVEED